MSNAIIDNLRSYQGRIDTRNASQKALKDFVAKAADHSERKADETRATAKAPAGYRRRFTFAEADAAVAALPEGRYALPRNTPDSAGNMITFFEVYQFTNKAGREVKKIVQLIADGGHDYAQKTLSVDFQVFAARHIADDVKGAMARYGHETNTCGKCGRPLSNDESRAAGIGPKCAKAL